MGTITISVDAGAGNASSKVFTIPNAALLRIINFAKDLNTEQGGGNLTNAQAIDFWATWAMNHTKQRVMIREKDKAAVADIPIS